MSKRVANIISYLFHPLLFPTYGAFLIIAVNPHLFASYRPKDQLLWIIITFIFTFICPVVWLVIMKQLELISDFQLENPKDRIIPYVAVITFYLWMFKFFKPISSSAQFSNKLLSMMMLGAALAISIGFFINNFRKISIHAIGAGSMLGLILAIMSGADYDLRLLFVASVLLAGMIGTSRLILGAHKHNELWAGYLTGFIGQFFSFTLLPFFMG